MIIYPNPYSLYLRGTIRLGFRGLSCGGVARNIGPQMRATKKPNAAPGTYKGFTAGLLLHGSQGLDTRPKAQQKLDVLSLSAAIFTRNHILDSSSLCCVPNHAHVTTRPIRSAALLTD